MLNTLSRRARQSVKAAAFSGYGRSLSTNANGTAGGFKVTKEAVATEAKEVFKLMFGTLTILLGGSMGVGYAVENYKRMHPPTPPGEIVDIEIDGHVSKVHAQVYRVADKSAQNVTVVLDGSLGETSFDWDKVASKISNVASVVAIDRPGLAFSTPGTQPRTSTKISREYQALFEKLGISGPVVLVGHGIGGYHMRQLASDLSSNPTGVTCSGIVLVDAMHESVRPSMEQISPNVKDALLARKKNAETLLKMSHFGLVRLVHTLQAKHNAARFLSTSLPFVDYYNPCPPHRRGVLHENEAVEDIESALLEAPLPVLKLPLAVLSHSNKTMFASMKMEPGINEAATDKMEEIWSQGQEALSKLSTQSVHQIVPDSGHDMAHEKPDVVASAIVAVINESQGDVQKGLKTLQAIKN